MVIEGRQKASILYERERTQMECAILPPPERLQCKGNANA